jgi:hypothetical protein
VAIFPQTAKFILQEHKHRPIEGDIVLIGRQSVLLTMQEALQLVKEAGVSLREKFFEEIDASTVGTINEGHITDRSFFSIFSPGKIKALDVSSYEGAEIIHNLNEPLPDRYHQIADFVFNGSCLDNLFDPASAIKALSAILRPAGRIIHVEHGSPCNGAFLTYSPEWFFDFYALNNYSDCKTFVCTFTNLHLPWNVFQWQPYVESQTGGLEIVIVPSGPLQMLNLVVAEKVVGSSDTKMPVQAHYRAYQKDLTEDIYVRQYLRFRQSPRSYTFAPVPKRPMVRALLKKGVSTVVDILDMMNRTQRDKANRLGNLEQIGIL